MEAKYQVCKSKGKWRHKENASMYRMFTFWSSRACVGAFCYEYWIVRIGNAGPFLCLIKSEATLWLYDVSATKKAVAKYQAKYNNQHSNDTVINKKHNCHANCYPEQDKSEHSLHKTPPFGLVTKYNRIVHNNSFIFGKNRVYYNI